MNKETKALLASWGRAFLATTFALILAGETDPKKLIWAGLAAVLPAVIRYLNPNDPQFGIKKK